MLRKDGGDEIFCAHLNARSFYVYDPANNILEFIVHYGLGHETDRAFGGASVLHVSEIGLPVEEVPAFVDLVHKQFTISPNGGSISSEIAFLGNISGQLVVVKIGRLWLPTETVRAAVAPVRLTISGQREQVASTT